MIRIPRFVCQHEVVPTWLRKCEGPWCLGAGKSWKAGKSRKSGTRLGGGGGGGALLAMLWEWLEISTYTQTRGRVALRGEEGGWRSSQVVHRGERHSSPQLFQLNSSWEKNSQLNCTANFQTAIAAHKAYKFGPAACSLGFYPGFLCYSKESDSTKLSNTAKSIKK